MRSKTWAWTSRFGLETWRVRQYTIVYEAYSTAGGTGGSTGRFTSSLFTFSAVEQRVEPFSAVWQRVEASLSGVQLSRSWMSDLGACREH